MCRPIGTAAGSSHDAPPLAQELAFFSIYNISDPHLSTSLVPTIITSTSLPRKHAHYDIATLSKSKAAVQRATQQRRVATI